MRTLVARHPLGSKTDEDFHPGRQSTKSRYRQYQSVQLSRSKSEHAQTRAGQPERSENRHGAICIFSIPCEMSCRSSHHVSWNPVRLKPAPVLSPLDLLFSLDPLLGRSAPQVLCVAPLSSPRSFLSF